MAKILGRDSIKSAVPKVVELQDEYIINGQVYNKSNMSPQPYQTLAIEDAVSGLLDPIMYESAYICKKDLSSVPRSKNSVLVDNQDTNITYVINNTNNATARFYKITKTATGYKQEKTDLITTFTASYAGYSEIIDQDENNVYVINNIGVNDTNAFNTRISQVSKSGMAVTISNLYGGRSRVIYKDSIYIYVAIISGAGILSIYRYTKSSATLTKVFTKAVENASQYTIKPFINEAVCKDDKISFYYFVDNIDSVSSMHKFTAKRCTLDAFTLDCTVKDVEVDFNGLDSTLLGLPVCAYYPNVILEQITLISNGVTYISLVPYTVGAYQTPTELNYIWTFKIVTDTKFVLASKEPLLLTYGTMLSLNNNNTLALANDSVVSFVKWDDSEMKYKETNRYVNEVSFISRDMNNIIWIQNKDTSIEQFSLSIPIEVYADFSEDEYEYSGEDINATILAYAKNFGGEYIEASIRLTLTGNCCFASNGEKTLTISTSIAKPLEIPVIIKDVSVIGVNTVVI